MKLDPPERAAFALHGGGGVDIDKNRHDRLGNQEGINVNIELHYEWRNKTQPIYKIEFSNYFRESNVPQGLVLVQLATPVSEMRLE
eukprot:gene23035-biopygen1992